MRSSGIRGGSLLEKAHIFTGFAPDDAVASPTTLVSSAQVFNLFDARIIEMLLIVGTPTGGPVTIQGRWQSTPLSPFSFVDIPNAEGPANTIVPGMYVAQLDASFLPAGHAFMRLEVDFVGAGTVPFAGLWVAHDLQQIDPRFYEQFPASKPTELVRVDTTMRGDNV